MNDPVNHPKHYTEHPSGIECIQITEHMGFCLGNAVKYLWRSHLKHANQVIDLKKAEWYIRREIQRLEANEHVERVSQRSAIRGEHGGASEDEGAAASEAVRHSYGLPSDRVLQPGDEAHRPVCASHGSGDLCGVMSGRLGGITSERGQLGQPAVELALREQEGKSRAESGPPDRLQRSAEPCCEADGSAGQGNQRVAGAGERTCQDLRGDACNHWSGEAGRQLASDLIWRADLKNDAIEDLEKAAWYIQREIHKRRIESIKL